MSAAAILRRSLFVWGWGHITLGDRRGWLLLVLQPLALIAVLLVALQLIDGTRWLVAFPPLVALLVAWLVQALHAYRRATQLGAAPGGEILAAFYLPLAVGMLTAFWLIGGRHGTPTATLEAYVLAWMSGRAQAAAPLYAVPPQQEQLNSTWAVQADYLAERVQELAAMYGPTSGLDPTEPFDNLRFSVPIADSPGRQVVRVDIVRLQRVENLVLGIVPTAGQETVVIEQAGTIVLRLHEQVPPAWLPIGRLQSQAWRIESVTIGDG